MNSENGIVEKPPLHNSTEKDISEYFVASDNETQYNVKVKGTKKLCVPVADLNIRNCAAIQLPLLKGAIELTTLNLVIEHKLHFR